VPVVGTRERRPCRDGRPRPSSRAKLGKRRVRQFTIQYAKAQATLRTIGGHCIILMFIAGIN